MDDGWWYECSISYNTWVAGEFTQVALAYEPFGINFRDLKVPASYSPGVSLESQLSGGVTAGATRGGAPQTVRHGARTFSARTPGRIATSK